MGKATALMNAISDPCFLLCLEIMSKVLLVTKPLSQKLQSPELDIMKAVDSVDCCIRVLEEYRNGDTFDAMFDHVEQSIGQPIPRPRHTKKQTHRANPPVTTAREHYRVAVFLMFIDVCLSQLRERFKSHRSRGLRLSSLIPRACVSSDFGSMSDALDMYARFLDGNADAVDAEFQLWKQHWLRRAEHERPNTVLGALREARDLDMFPAIATLLQIFATLPVTTATNERAFSTLKYLKNYLRSTMHETRLNGMTLLYVHRDIPLNYDKVVDKFGSHNRRLNFQ